MTAPVRLQLSRRRGFDLQAVSLAANGLSAVNCARPGPFGNPFMVGKDGDAAYVVALHAHMLASRFALGKTATVDEQKEALRLVEQHWHALPGRNLACWCKSGAPCHADTLLRLASAEPAA